MSRVRGMPSVFCLVGLLGCGPNHSQQMALAAQQQAKAATGPIGTVDEVRAESRQGSNVLKGLSANFLKASQSGSSNALALAFGQAAAEVSSGLDAIADSRTDEQFTAAVFGMCDTQRQVAAYKVGQVLVGTANGISAKPPPSASAKEVGYWSNYLSTFGERLIDIPSKCSHADKAMAQVEAEEQQAEAEHRANVNAAVTAAEILFAGAVVYESARASRPIIAPVQNNYYYGQSFN